MMAEKKATTRDSLYKNKWWLTALMLLVIAGLIYIGINVALQYTVILFRYLPASLKGTADAASFRFQWSYLLSPPTPISPVMTALFSATLALLFGMKLVRRIQQKLFPQTTLEGSSRWAKPEELKKEFQRMPVTLFRDNTKLDMAYPTGIIVAKDQSNYYMDDSDSNTMVFGATRSGKTQYELLPTLRMLIYDRRSFIVNDIKGELIENIKQHLKAAGYRVRVLNLRDPHLSNGWDVLRQIKLLYQAARCGEMDLSQASEAIADLAHVLTVNMKSDPVWPASAQALLEAIMRYLLDDAYDNHRMENLSIYGVVTFYIEYAAKVVRVGKEQFNALDMIMQELPPGNWAKNAYATCQLAGGEMLSSIRATLSSNLAIFMDVGIAQLTARDEIRFDELYDTEQPTAIFMIVPDEKSTRHKLVSLFVTQSYAALVGAAYQFPKQRLPRRVTYMLDEFGVLPTVPDMGIKVSACLSRGISFMLCAQDIPQLDAKYGKETTKNILNNCANRIYLLAGDPDTNKYISDLLAKETVEYSTYMGESGDILNNRRNTHIKARELKTTDELQRVKMGQVICLRTRCYPMLSDMIPYYDLKVPLVPIGEMGLQSTAPVPMQQLLYPYIFAEKKPETGSTSDFGLSSSSSLDNTPAAPTQAQPAASRDWRQLLNTCNLYTAGAFGRLITSSPDQAIALAEKLLKEKKITDSEMDLLQRMVQNAE